MADERPGWPIAAIVTVLVVVNVGMNRGLPSWAYVPWAVGWTGALLWFARRVDGRSWSDLGLSRADAPRGLRWGAVLGGTILVIYVVGFAVPGTRELFLDERVHGWSLGEAAFAALVRVPLGTVLIEEVAFRAVLPAMAAARWSRAVTVAFASVLFGLWHLLPALGIADVNPVTADSVGDLPAWVSVTGATVSTAIVGAWFWWLRARSGSVLAPMALHWSTNGLGYLFAYAAWRW